MLEHLDRLRSKPEHVRRNIALGSAGVLTALLAIGWLAATISGGMLALKPVPLDGGSRPAIAAVPESSSAFSKLVGAAGAATGFGTPKPAPSLQIVDGGTSSTIEEKPAAASSQTIIPF
ncbi:MAG: hypothetical protein WDN10_01675 [bacterium]